MKSVLFAGVIAIGFGISPAHVKAGPITPGA